MAKSGKYATNQCIVLLCHFCFSHNIFNKLLLFNLLQFQPTLSMYMDSCIPSVSIMNRETVMERWENRVGWGYHHSYRQPTLLHTRVLKSSNVLLLRTHKNSSILNKLGGCVDRKKLNVKNNRNILIVMLRSFL